MIDDDTREAARRHAEQQMTVMIRSVRDHAERLGLPSDERDLLVLAVLRHLGIALVAAIDERCCWADPVAEVH